MPRPQPFSAPRDPSASGITPAETDRPSPGNREHPPFCDNDLLYTFTFSNDLQTVEGMSRVTDSTTQVLDLTGSIFETIVGINDLGVQAVLSVEQTRTATRSSDVRIYSDSDGDGKYVEDFDLHVATTATPRLPQHQFTFADDGSVLTDQRLHHGQWSSETIDSTEEVYQHLTLDGETYVVKTVQDSDGDYHFEILRDDNGDGIWTGIARGESSGVYVDTAADRLNLVGVQEYLSAADSIVG